MLHTIYGYVIISIYLLVFIVFFFLRKNYLIIYVIFTASYLPYIYTYAYMYMWVWFYRKKLFNVLKYFIYY